MVQWNTFAWLNLRHVPFRLQPWRKTGDEIDNQLRKSIAGMMEKFIFSCVELDVWQWLMGGEGTCVYVEWIVYTCLCIIVSMKDNMREYTCVYTGVRMYV